MRNKGFILFFAITFAIICIYSLSFTICTRRVENKAREYAQNDPTREELREKANGDAFMETYLLDSSYKARETEYLNLMSDSVVYNLLVAKWTYQECKELELNLGLDLKGGMNVMLEISVTDIMKSLAGNGANDSLFIRTMNLALEKQKKSQADFVTLFDQSFREVAPENARLATIFRNLSLKEGKNSNADVIQALREETEAAFDNTFRILRTRIDKFGVAQPNIQRLAQSGRIMIELPGVKEPERVRKLLQGTANLEFWKTYEFSEIQDVFIQANDRIAEYNKAIKDTTTVTEDTAQVIPENEMLVEEDTASTQEGLPEITEEMEDSSDVEMTEQEFKEQNPLFTKFELNRQPSPETGKYGPLVGYCLGKDTAEINRMLGLDIVKNLFPLDLVLCWHAKTGKDKSSVYQLIALKKSGNKESDAVLDGKVIVDASQDFNDRSGNEISMSMNREGATKWKKITEDNLGNSIAIVLDNLVYSFPTVNSIIPNGRSSITGAFSLEEAKDLANLLKAGKLPAPAIIVSEEIVGPTLGKESINSSMLSFLIAFVLVLFYMFFFYNRGGLVAGFALLINIVFIMGTLASLGAVLTLPGIAGIVLTLGMAVDANVIIYERIKEELRSGKALRLSIADGYKAAYSAIIDGNVTTIITGIILYVFGSGPVQGFATTLIIGLLTSLFTAIFISRLVFNWALSKNMVINYGNQITMNAFANTKIDFLSKRKLFYGASIFVILVGAVSLLTKGMDMGIDFAGGRSYTVRFDKPVSVNELRNSLTQQFNGIAPEVKTFGSDNQIKITTKWRIDENNIEVDSLAEVKLYEGLKPFFGTAVTREDFSVQNQNVGLISSQKVGATVSRDMKRDAFLAVIFSLIAIFVYIAIRFRNWQYGLGGVVSLLNVALFTIGLFSLFSGILPFTMEVDQSFIAAVLTIIGYAINDGVVIFDRIRENRQLYPKRDLKEIMNSALNSTLGRTINTTGTTLVVLLAIFLFGGTVIRGFVFALLIGIAYGAYSSICIGASLVFDTSKKKNLQQLKEKEKK
ncbi:MAG: protein translocase subunit SecDF [Bacteroidales bacterium]|jgi:SecD/SecF fusion protein|nr:protein translocase subunit SecDF [Bacteroidales bacterium]